MHNTRYNLSAQFISHDTYNKTTSADISVAKIIDRTASTDKLLCSSYDIRHHNYKLFFQRSMFLRDLAKNQTNNSSHRFSLSSDPLWLSSSRGTTFSVVPPPPRPCSAAARVRSVASGARDPCWLGQLPHPFASICTTTSSLLRCFAIATPLAQQPRE